jgi:GNAT superfamily N-acetyltransferase
MEIKKSSENTYTATENGEEIGWATIFKGEDDQEDDGSVLIERLDVDESYRNHGIGTALINAIRNDYDDIIIVPDNEDAARLYERLGEPSTKDYAGYLDEGFGVYDL